MWELRKTLLDRARIKRIYHRVGITMVRTALVCHLHMLRVYAISMVTSVDSNPPLISRKTNLEPEASGQIMSIERKLQYILDIQSLTVNGNCGSGVRV